MVNYNDEDVPYTRIIEFRALPPRARLPRRTRPSSCASSPASPRRATSPTTRSTPPTDRDELLKYRDLAAAEPMVLFGGRLGTYKYLDMHMAIGSALTMFENKLRPHFDGRRQA